MSQNDGSSSAKHTKQQNLQSLLNSSLQVKARSNSIKQQQQLLHQQLNSEVQEYYPSQSLQSVHQQVSQTLTSAPYQNTRGSKPQVISSSQQVGYLINQQKDSLHPQAVPFASTSLNQQQLSLIQFNISSNLKNQKARTFQNHPLHYPQPPQLVQQQTSSQQQQQCQQFSFQQSPKGQTVQITPQPSQQQQIQQKKSERILLKGSGSSRSGLEKSLQLQLLTYQPPQQEQIHIYPSVFSPSQNRSIQYIPKGGHLQSEGGDTNVSQKLSLHLPSHVNSQQQQFTQYQQQQQQNPLQNNLNSSKQTKVNAIGTGSLSVSVNPTIDSVKTSKMASVICSKKSLLDKSLVTITKQQNQQNLTSGTQNQQQITNIAASALEMLANQSRQQMQQQQQQQQNYSQQQAQQNYSSSTTTANSSSFQTHLNSKGNSLNPQLTNKIMSMKKGIKNPIINHTSLNDNANFISYNNSKNANTNEVSQNDHVNQISLNAQSAQNIQHFQNTLQKASQQTPQTTAGGQQQLSYSSDQQSNLGSILQSQMSASEKPLIPTQQITNSTQSIENYKNTLETYKKMLDTFNKQQQNSLPQEESKQITVQESPTLLNSRQQRIPIYDGKEESHQDKQFRPCFSTEQEFQYKTHMQQQKFNLPNQQIVSQQMQSENLNEQLNTLNPQSYSQNIQTTQFNQLSTPSNKKNIYQNSLLTYQTNKLQLQQQSQPDPCVGEAKQSNNSWNTNNGKTTTPNTQTSSQQTKAQQDSSDICIYSAISSKKKIETVPQTTASNVKRTPKNSITSNPLNQQQPQVSQFHFHLKNQINTIDLVDIPTTSHKFSQIRYIFRILSQLRYIKHPRKTFLCSSNLQTQAIDTFHSLQIQLECQPSTY